MACGDKITELKMKLHFATKQKLKLEKKLNSLRNRELFITEEITLTKTETDFLLFQTAELSREIAKMKNQTTVVDMYNASESSKIDVYLRTLEEHKTGYEEIFKREQATLELQNEELKKKEDEQMELERQKMAKLLEDQEQRDRDTAAIEDECDVIDQECAVLMKRNKAIMLQLRRKLNDTEHNRNELLNNN